MRDEEREALLGVADASALAFRSAYVARLERALRPEEMEPLMARLCEISDRVQGNRSNRCKVKWADARLCLRSTLERCIEILDAEEPPQL